MNEAQLTKAVIDLARLKGWRTAHFRAAMTKAGNWTTAVQGDGKGFPDLVLVRPPLIIFAELKVGYNKLSDEQQQWLEAIQKCESELVAYYLWRDKDWESGEIDRCLL